MSSVRSALAAFKGLVDAPVAPQVAVRLAEYAQYDSDVLATLARQLSSAQLAGRSQLPEPLPYVSTHGVSAVLNNLTQSQRRLLLIAALVATDSVAIVLDASAVDVDVLLSEKMSGLVRIRDGKFRFIDERVRVGLISQENTAALQRIHAAISRASRRAGLTSLAAWHLALASEDLDVSGARALIQVAEDQLGLGAANLAQRIATYVIIRSPAETRSVAVRVAARAALWAGHLDDALELAMQDSNAKTDEHLAATARISRMLLDGAPEDSDPRRRVISHYAPLGTVTAGAEDNRAMGTLVEMANLWWLDPHGTDALQAGLTLSTRQAHTVSLVLQEQRAPSPLAEAHVRLMQAAFQLQAGDKEGARNTLEEAISRLPLVAPGAGIVASLIDMAADPSTIFDVDLANAYRAVSPPSVIRYNVYGPETGQRTTTASRHLRSTLAPTTSTSQLVKNSGLTPREQDVVVLLTEGLPNGVIGNRLGISARTVEVHLSRVYQKLGVSSRSGLISVLLREDVRERTM